VLPVMCAVVDDDRAATLDVARATIAFYGSTPAYRAVLEHHGWGELGDELHALSRRGEWATVGSLVEDEVVDEFCAVGDIAEVAAKVTEKFGGLVDRFQLGLGADDERFSALVSALQS